MDAATVTSTGTWLDGCLSRLGLHGTLAQDAATAGAAAVAMLAVAAVTVEVVPVADAPPAATVPWLLALVVVQCLALSLRRVALAGCVVMVVATQLALVALAPDMSVRTVAPVGAAVTIATRLPTRRALWVVGGAVVIEAAGGAATAAARDAGTEVVVQHAASAVLIWGGSLLLGLYLATRREHLALLEERAARLEQERDDRVRAAVADERARLARELHDVAAHHLSGMVVQAAAVERLVDRDPPAAQAGAAWLRDQGRAALDNLRQVVGLLRGEDGDPLRAVPGVDALPDLVRDAQALGDDVCLEHTGTSAPLPPLADVSVYRVAQQALTNARQHAHGAPVRMTLTQDASGVVLQVDNGPAAHGPMAPHATSGGIGLAVMRERATLVGATLETGPTDDGGWRVRLHLPLTESERR